MEGGIFKRHWWGFWQPNGIKLEPVRVKMADGSLYECRLIELPEAFDEVIQSWDMAFKDTQASAFVVGQVWARLMANRFLLDQRRERLNLPATIRAVRELTGHYPQAGAKLVEDKANGPAVIQTLRNEIPGLLAVNPEGDKVARAHAVTWQIEAGNVFLPHPVVAPWVNDLIERFAKFPNVAFKDEVDAGTQALNRWNMAIVDGKIVF
jgi:predicted phage terminase large subunit-like protein